MSNFANIYWSQILLGFWIESFLLLLRVNFYLLQSLPCIGEHRLQHNRVLNNILSKHKSKKDQILNNIQSKGGVKILEGNEWKDQSKIVKWKETSKIREPSSLYCWVFAHNCIKSWKRQEPGYFSVLHFMRESLEYEPSASRTCLRTSRHQSFVASWQCPQASW